MTPPPVVVTPADRPAALFIARSLGRRGVPVYSIDWDPTAMCLRSKYSTPRLIPEFADLAQTLLDLGQELGTKAVLFPVSDPTVLLCSRERDVLRRYYEFVMPDHKTVEDLLTKDGLSIVAHECNMPAPHTVHALRADTIEAIADELAYPVILKPAHSVSWLRPEVASLLRDSWLDGQAKVALCRDADELRQTYEAISVYDDHLIVQEMIPGPDHGLVYACFYLDRQSKVMAFFAGRKLRVLPVGFGSATYVRSFHDPELEEITYRLLDCVGYQGLGGIEFKRDPRDETYKLIEFNARFGLWDSLGIKCGVDIPHIAYLDALGQPVTPQLSYREGVLWIDLQRDFRAFLRYRQRGELSWINWLRSLQGEKQWSTYDRDDWRPGLTEDLNVLGRQWKAIRRHLPYIGGK